MHQRDTPLPTLARGSSSLTMALALGLLGCTGSLWGASANPLAGEILGQVRNAAGIAQMGASVYLYNRYDETVRRALSNEQGRFVFDALAPDLYSIRVILASFVPAERRNIAVLPSSENRLDINMASVLSTVDLTSSPVLPGALMTDDWKWVLRTSQATRPVLRLLPDFGPPPSASSHPLAAFSDTTGVVQISAGEGDSFAAGAQQDLGTAFALATSLAGGGRVQFDGNVGSAVDSPLPGAGIRTSYTHSSGEGSNPEFVMTARQIYLAPRTGSGEMAPALRTLSTAFLDRIEVADHFTVDYGASFDSVAYIQRVNTLSSFLRTSYDAGRWGRVRTGFSAGAHPSELLARDQEKSGNLEQDFVALASLPQVSRSGGDLTTQHTRSAEISWERIAGSRTYSAGVFEETVSNASFMLSAPADPALAADLLPDLNSKSSIFNVGSYQRAGVTGAVKQALGERAEFTVSAGRTGALLADGAGASSADGQDLRAGLRQGQRNWITWRVAGTLPRTGTRISANYGWTDFHVLMPAHYFITQAASQDIGVNVYVRQPLPRCGMPWRVEAIAELRNLLAQGYIPIDDGAQRSVLTNAPRALRGGLNFIF
jgi:hypothetical protein